MDVTMSTLPLLLARNQSQNDGRIDTMTTMEPGRHDRHITVEVSNRRLPIWMVAGRLRNNLRYPGDVLQPRSHSNGRVAMAVLVMPVVGLTRMFSKPGSSVV